MSAVCPTHGPVDAVVWCEMFGHVLAEGICKTCGGTVKPTDSAGSGTAAVRHDLLASATGGAGGGDRMEYGEDRDVWGNESLNHTEVAA